MRSGASRLSKRTLRRLSCLRKPPSSKALPKLWIPACAGMTTWEYAIELSGKRAASVALAIRPRGNRSGFGKSDIVLPGCGKCSISVPMTKGWNPSAEATRPEPPARRSTASKFAPDSELCQRSVTARRTPRRNRAEREARIVSLLNRGVAIAEIAAREGLSPKRMRNLVREILARRMPQPPASSSRFRSAVSTKRCSCLTARCTRPRRERTSRRSIAWSKSCASSTAITDLRRVARPREEPEARRLAAPVANAAGARRPKPERLGNGAARR